MPFFFPRPIGLAPMSLVDQRLSMVVGSGAASYTSVGASIGTVGTLSVNAQANTNGFTAGRRVIHASAAAINSPANVGTQLMWLPASVSGPGGFDFYARCGHDIDVASTRFFVGLVASATILGASAEPSAQTSAKIGIGLDSTDTNYQLMYNASGATSSKLDLGVARASGTAFDVWLYSQKGTVGISYQINNAATGATIASGTLTSLIPGASDFLAFQLLGNTAAAVSALKVSLARMVCLTDY